MQGLLHEIGERLKAVAGGWTQFVALGSFVLYLTGYLALRFHLTMLGIVSDLPLLDERYLFTGARFFVNLAAAVPVIVFLAIPPVALGWLVWRVVPAARAAATRLPRPSAAVSATAAVLWAVMSIQLLMRQCFALQDVLLAADLGQTPPWLLVVMREPMLLQQLYLAALVVVCLVTLALGWPALRAPAPSAMFSAARGLLLLLLAVQALLLPVNYGVLICDKSLARVAAPGAYALPADAQAWLAWEGASTSSFLLRQADGRRSLLVQPKAQSLPLEVLGVDPIVPTLFGPRGEPLTRRPP